MQVRLPLSLPNIARYWYFIVAVVVGTVAPARSAAISFAVVKPLLSMERS